MTIILKYYDHNYTRIDKTIINDKHLIKINVSPINFKTNNV